MEEKTCCGFCSLRTGTTLALFISAIEAVYGIFWNIHLLLLMNKSETFNVLDMFIDVNVIVDFDVVHGLTLAAIGMNGFWLIFAAIAGRGNISLSHGMLAFWDLFTYLVTVFDIGTTIYFSIKVQEFPPELSVTQLLSKNTTYFTLLLLFSKGGIMLFINLYLAHIVQMRGKQIDHDHSVLALYILSHIAKCNRANGESQPKGYFRPPPAYGNPGPPYSPPTSLERRSGSSGSNWSLSCDTITSGQPFTFLQKPSAGNGFSSIDLVKAFSREPDILYQPLPSSRGSSTVLPY